MFEKFRLGQYFPKKVEAKETGFNTELETTLPEIEVVEFKRRLEQAGAAVSIPQRRVITDRYKMPPGYQIPVGMYEMVADNVDPSNYENLVKTFRLLGYKVEKPGMYSFFTLTPERTLEDSERYTLRIRKDGNTWHFTVKGPVTSESNLKERLEEDVVVKDPKDIKQFLTTKGILLSSHIEKNRETFILGTSTIEIDIYPSSKAKPRAEIEAKTPQQIQDALRVLGYSGKQISIGESEYLKKQGLTKDEIRNLAFQND